MAGTIAHNPCSLRIVTAMIFVCFLFFFFYRHMLFFLTQYTYILWIFFLLPQPLIFMMVNNLIKAGNQLLFIYFLIENEDLSSQSKSTQNQGKHQICSGCLLCFSLRSIWVWVYLKSLCFRESSWLKNLINHCLLKVT